MYAAVVGRRVPEEPTRHDLQELLEATKDTPAARAIHFAVLRTLTKASYSPALIGHYALASDHYAHFTSPIRRYPDLTLHRALDAYLDLTDNGRQRIGGAQRKKLARKLAQDPRTLDEEKLVTVGRHCSDMEVEAEGAERELRDFLVMQFLHEHHLGDEFPGVVTGAIGSGVFVSIEKFLVEGLVRVEDLPGAATGGGGGKPDRWKVNEATGRLVAQRSGATVGIGDIVTVQIVQVDLASRHLDLLMTKLPERTAVQGPASAPAARHDGQRKRGKGKGKGKQKSKKRQGPRKHR
jgi:ribonuclease R